MMCNANARDMIIWPPNNRESMDKILLILYKCHIFYISGGTKKYRIVCALCVRNH